MFVEKHSVAILTDASGDFTGYTATPVTGAVLQYRYVPHGTAPLDTGADLDVTGEESGVVLVNQDNIGTSAFTKLPRQGTHDQAGVASLFAAVGEPVEASVVVAAERLKVVVAAGGNVKQGTLHIWVGDA